MHLWPHELTPSLDTKPSMEAIMVYMHILYTSVIKLLWYSEIICYTELRKHQLVECLYAIQCQSIIGSNAELLTIDQSIFVHDDVIKWKHFLRYWLFVRGIHRSPVNSNHKGQWRGALMFYFICRWTNGWANHRDAGDLRRHRTHYGVTVMVDVRWRNNFRHWGAPTRNIIYHTLALNVQIVWRQHNVFPISITSNTGIWNPPP